MLGNLSVKTALSQAASGATLSVLATTVEVASRGGAFGPARDGMTLGPGDQVRTSNAGVAVRFVATPCQTLPRFL